MKTWKTGALWLALGLFVLPSILAAQQAAYPLIAQQAAPLDTVDRRIMPAMDNKALVENAEAAEGNSGPYFFAEPIPVALDKRRSGTWETLPDGSRLWRQVILSPEATSLNFGFLSYWMPKGGQLTIYTPGGSTVLGPFTSADNESHGQLWTPIIPGDEAVIEVRLPAGKEDELLLSLDVVNHGFRPLQSGTDRRSGSCNVDVVCPAGDGWRDQIRSVGVYTVSGVWTCTGALINNTAGDGRGYFLTAYHCGVRTADAPSVVVYWGYENSTCRPVGSAESGGDGDGSLSVFNTGTLFRSQYSPTDVTLLEMDDPINPSYEPFFAGWDRSGTGMTNATAIHHPNTDEKRISFEYDAPTVTSYYSNSVPGDGTHIRIADWDVGTTEPGSSGSPLFDQNQRIIGQLHGGDAACGNDLPDWYGRLALSWTGGGTAATRLSDWLDPLGTGVQAIDGLGASDLRLDGNPVVSDAAGDNDGVIESGETGIQLFVSVENVGDSEISNLTGTLTTDQGTAVVTQPNANYPVLAADASGSNISPFEFSVTPGHECGEALSFSLFLTNGEVSLTAPITIETGPVCNVVTNIVTAELTDSDDTAGNGNGNGQIDPGENAIGLTISLENVGKSTDMAVGTLTSQTGTVSVVPGYGQQAYPLIPTGESRTNTEPFRLSIDPQHSCGDPIELELTVQTEDGEKVFELLLNTGGIGQVTRQLSPGVTFGLNPETVNVDVQITDSGTVQDVNLTVTITHTYVSDMIITLRSPQGTEAILFNHLGLNGDNLTNTVFDDEAAESITDGSPPYTGSFRPGEPLSAFDGEPVNGTWRITVEDTEFFDEGTFVSARLDFVTASGDCEPPLDVPDPPTGDMNGDGSVTFGDAQAVFECFMNDACEGEMHEEEGDLAPDNGNGCLDEDDGDDKLSPADAQRVFELALDQLTVCI